MRTIKKNKSIVMDIENEENIIDQLRRNIVPNYFTEKDRENLSKRLHKVVSDVIREGQK